MYYYLCNKTNVFFCLIVMSFVFFYTWSNHSNNINEKGDKYLKFLSEDVPLIIFGLLFILGIVSNKLNKDKLITFQNVISRGNKPLICYILSNIFISFVFFILPIIMFIFLCFKNGANDSENQNISILLEYVKGIIILIDYLHIALVYSFLSYHTKSEVKGFFLSVLYFLIQLVFSIICLFGCTYNRILFLFLTNSTIIFNIISVSEYGLFPDSIISMRHLMGSMLFGILTDLLFIYLIISCKKNRN